MDFGIGNAVVAFFVAWQFWAIVAIGVVLATAVVLWKAIITPKEYSERLAWAQAKENQRLSQPLIRRWATTIMIWMFGLMASTLFCVAMYKVLTD